MCASNMHFFIDFCFVVMYEKDFGKTIVLYHYLKIHWKIFSYSYSINGKNRNLVNCH